MKTYQEIVKDIKLSKDVNIVKSPLTRINITDAGNGLEKVTIQVADSKLKRVSVDSTGTQKVEDLDFCNISAYGFWAALRESKLKIALKKIRRDYDLLDVLLDGATIEITQIKVPAKTDYVNPFSEDTTKVSRWDVDKYISFVTNIVLSKEGEEDLKQMKRYMLMGCKE